MYTDFVLNGSGHGDFGSALGDVRFDTGLLRPFKDYDGKDYCVVNTGRTQLDPKTGKTSQVKEKVLVKDLVDNNIPVANATLGLRLDEWRLLDEAVLRETRNRFRAYQDLLNTNSYGGFDGMSALVLEHEVMDDPGEAIEDMDGLTDSRNDEMKFEMRGLPLPITHAGFYLSSRKLAVSRRMGTPLDTTLIEANAHKVAERIEKVTLGVADGFSIGIDTRYDAAAQTRVYGYTNHPDRATKTDCTAPTATNGTTIVSEVLALRELLIASGFYGPYMLYVSTGYDAVLDNDLKTESSITVRQRLREIDGINDVRRVDYLTGNQLILVQMTADVARAVNGMSIQTVMWETQGRMKRNFRIMGIQVPQIRSTISNRCGVAHGTTS